MDLIQSYFAWSSCRKKCAAIEAIETVDVVVRLIVRQAL